MADLKLISACVVAVFLLIVHPTHRENFPWLLAGLAAGGAGAGGLGYMKSGAIWSSGSRPPNVVSFYKDVNFGGPRKDYPVGAVQNSLSKGKLGMGVDKENDTYSSLQVPPGMQVQVWEHNDKKGATYVYGPGAYPNLNAQGFHDKISSLVVSARP